MIWPAGFVQTHRFRSSLLHLRGHTHSWLDPIMSRRHRDDQAVNTYTHTFLILVHGYTSNSSKMFVETQRHTPLLDPTHKWSVAARLMMECSGRLERHSHEVWLTKVTMTTVRSILGGDSSISWEGGEGEGNKWKFKVKFMHLAVWEAFFLGLAKCERWVDLMGWRLRNFWWPVSAKRRPTAVGRVCSTE